MRESEREKERERGREREGEREEEWEYNHPPLQKKTQTSEINLVEEDARLPKYFAFDSN